MTNYTLDDQQEQFICCQELSCNLLRVELALNDRQRSGKCKLVNQITTVYQVEKCFISQTSSEPSHVPPHRGVMESKHTLPRSKVCQTQQVQPVGQIQLKKFGIDWSHQLNPVLLLIPDDIQISFLFLWLKKHINTFSKMQKWQLHFRPVPSQQTGKSRKQSNISQWQTQCELGTILSTFFNFNLLILGPYKPFSDGSKIFIQMVT